jgi:hypothetical protein
LRRKKSPRDAFKRLQKKQAPGLHVGENPTGQPRGRFLHYGPQIRSSSRKQLGERKTRTGWRWKQSLANFSPKFPANREKYREYGDFYCNASRISTCQRALWGTRLSARRSSSRSPSMMLGRKMVSDLKPISRTSPFELTFHPCVKEGRIDRCAYG